MNGQEPAPPSSGRGDERPREDAGERQLSSRPWWWLTAPALVIGVLVGVLVAGLLIRSGPGTAAASGASPSSATAASPSSSAPAAGGATGQVAVDDACLRVINQAQDAVTALSGADQAVQRFNAARLDEIVRQLEPIEDRLQAALADCRVTPSGSVGSPTTDRPSASSAS